MGYPETVFVWGDKTASDSIASSDPNTIAAAIEETQGLLGTPGKPQSWMTTLTTLLRRYRHDMRIESLSNVLYARAGEAVLENTDGSLWVYRRNASDVTIGAANIDAGTLAETYYYVYAKGNGAATTAPICFSTDAYAPSGIGTAPYRQLGWFYNAAAAALAATFAGNNPNLGLPNVLGVKAAADITTTSASYVDMTGMTINMISHGRPVLVHFNAPIRESSNNDIITVAIDIDGADKIEQNIAGQSLAYHIADVVYQEILAAGAHVIKVEWKISGNTAYQYGATDGPRTLFAREI